MQQEKIISLTNYAKMRGVSRQRIQFMIKRGMQLPGVAAYYKTGEGTSHYILILE